MTEEAETESTTFAGEQPPKPPRKPKVTHKVDELEAMRQCDRLISQVPDAEKKARIAQWLFDRHGCAGYLSNSRAEAAVRQTFGEISSG